jgi:hypothetical protein
MAHDKGVFEPDSKYDLLPQPYRKINKIVEDILKKVFDTIYFPSREFQENRKRQKEKSEEEHAPLLEPALIHSATVIISDFNSTYKLRIRSY